MLRSIMQKHIACLLAATALAACASPPQSPPQEAAHDWPAPTLGHARPLVIAHRGASGERPEHTIEGYKLAIKEGADCIEPDLVMTKDGVLVDRHDTFLSTTTDVAKHPEFADRKRRSPDPEFTTREDWWVADFTLAELKTLRAVQSFPGRSKDYDGLYDVPTFDEVLALAKANRTTSGHPVCVYPEAKSPAYHAGLGMDMVQPILAGLKKAGMDKKGSPIFIQSFEPPFVKAIQPLTDLPVIMLVADKAGLDAALATPGAPYWDGLGPNIPVLFNADGTSSGVVEAAHAKGIAVHPWTFRTDAPIKAAPFNGEPAIDSMKRTLALGVDGFFTDFPAVGVEAVDSFK
jgi:glycerophosphoryl diester phosphodiesterase